MKTNKKNSVKKFYIIFIYLFAVLASHSIAQQKNGIDSIDNHLFALENERLADTCSDAKQKAFFLLKKAKCLKNLKQYKQAYTSICSIETNALPDSLSYQIRYEAALMALLSNNIEGLKINLLFLDQNKETEKHLFEFCAIKMMYFNQVRDYSNAYYTAIQYIDSKKISIAKKDSMKRAFAKLYVYNRPQEVQPETMAILSGIVPGSAQILMGHIGEGISGLLINVGLFSLGVYDLFNGLYITSFAVIINLFPRFYMAGIKRAKSIAIEKNECRIQQFEKESLLLLEQ